MVQDQLWMMAVPVLLLAGSCRHQVTIETDVTDAGQECFRINLSNASLYYQKEAGGFSSILDRDGLDWVGFKKDTVQQYPDNAASEYRGLPNLVFGSDDSGAGHPGFEQCRSELISDNKIQTTSKSGKWQWTWTFYSDYAELLVEKSDPDHAYWFLYEGIPGGGYRPQKQYWGNNKEGPLRSIPDYYFGNARFDTWQWVYFGEDSVDRVFYILHVQQDELPDTFSYLGNTEEGVISPDGMVVFGFGRADNAMPLFTSPGQKFIMGFWENRINSPEDHEKLKESLERILKKSG